MGKVHESITPDLEAWLLAQHIYFVGTAPLAATGHVNCSPKGMDLFRILGPKSVAYLDLTGSGVETVAHVRENGRIVLMFCAFAGAPRIVRLHGRGSIHEAGGAEFEKLAVRFPDHQGARSIVVVDLDRISDSCGFSVPFYDYRGERDQLVRWAEQKGPAGLVAYRQQKNRTSIDGLPGLRAAAQ